MDDIVSADISEEDKQRRAVEEFLPAVDRLIDLYGHDTIPLDIRHAQRTVQEDNGIAVTDYEPLTSIPVQELDERRFKGHYINPSGRLIETNPNGRLV